MGAVPVTTPSNPLTALSLSILATSASAGLGASLLQGGMPTRGTKQMPLNWKRRRMPGQGAPPKPGLTGDCWRGMADSPCPGAAAAQKGQEGKRVVSSHAGPETSSRHTDCSSYASFPSCFSTRGEPKKPTEFISNIKHCVFILTCLNFSRLQSALHLMQYAH